MNDDANLEAMVAEVQEANGQKPEPAAKPDKPAKPEKVADAPQPDAAATDDAKSGAEAATGGEAAAAADDTETEDDAGGADTDGDAKPQKRDKSLKSRFKELTDRVKTAEAEVARLRDVQKPAKAEGDAPQAPQRPDPAAFEYGPADPAYQKAFEDYQDKIVDFKLEQRLATERTNADAAAQQKAVRDRVQAGLNLAEAEGKERYADFDAKISEAVTARQGKPMPAVVTIAIGASPVGADVLYSLAASPEASQKLERMVDAGDMQGAALAFGELEGVHTDDDSDLVLSDPLDMMRLNGRMKSRMAAARAGKQPKAHPADDEAGEGDDPPVQPKPVNVTKAPEPPPQRARGSGGRMKASADTKDIDAFMRDFGDQLVN